MRKLLFICLAAGLATPAGATVPLRTYYGQELTWRNARDVAHAGAVRFDAGPGNLFTHPARLGFAPVARVEATGALRWADEQRTRTVYDQFENAIGEVVVADNANVSGIPGPLAGVVPLFDALAVGAGVAPVMDFEYRYDKVERDDFYNILKTDHVSQSGRLFTGNLALAWRPVSWLSVGATGGYLFGDRRLSVTEERSDTVYVLESEDGRPGGIRYGGGLAFMPIAPLSFDLGYQSGVTLDEWVRPEAPADAETRDLPWSARAGVAYRAPGNLPSVLTAEASYQAWSAVESTWSSVFIVRAGAEHTMLNGVKLRYGFGLEPLPYDATVQLVQVGAGVGFDAKVVKVDVGAMFQRDVIGPALFTNGLEPDDQRVYESGAVLAVTFSRDF